MTGPDRAAAVSPARAVAYAVLRRVFEQDAWADRVLHGEAGRARLDARDRALATQLAYGAVQRAATLDHVIAAFARRPVEQLDPPLRAALRLGAFQLVFLDGIAAHAAVGESVELAKADAPRGAGLVNAVLRRTAREGRALAAALPERTAAEAALRHSYPPWLAERWFEALGRRRRPRADGGRQPPGGGRAARERAAHDRRGARRRAAGGHAPGRAAAGGARARGRLRRVRLAAVGAGRVHAAVARRDGGRADPRPGRRRARARPLRRPGRQDHAPGRADGGPGRGGRGRAPRRSRAGARAHGRAHGGGERGGAHGRRRAAAGARGLRPRAGRPAVLGSRHARLAARRALAQGGGRARGARRACRARSCAPAPAPLRPGGTLVYSTCTISPEENEHVVDAFLAERPDFTADDLGSSEWSVWQHGRRPMFLQTLPHRHGTDGFFIARLRRSGSA